MNTDRMMIAVGAVSAMVAVGAGAFGAHLLRARLSSYLEQTGDPRVAGAGHIWETYPRFSPLRWFPTPEWALENPESVPRQDWLEARRPR